MGIITLTTDLGNTDFYQAALKGSLLSLYPEARIVDISHNISSFDIQNAAFVLGNAYPYFPKGTVHLIGIDSVYSDNAKFVALKYKGHYFVGTDNGIFSLMFDGEPSEIVELSIMQDLKYLHFPLTDIFSKAACHLAKGGALKDIGDPVPSIVERSLIQPVVEEKVLKGSVIYIDSFGNAITNIGKELFNRKQKGRDFTVHFKRNESINQLSWHYNEVPEGEKLCLFGISDLLEISINKGNASKLLGLTLGEIIRIEFS